MKHLFTVLLVASSAVCFAQGNLQFNQVLTFEGGADQTWYKPSVNKVWKIESALITSGTCANSLKVNNVKASGAANNSTSFPIWINDEDSIQVVPCPGPAQYFISVIEFNVIP